MSDISLSSNYSAIERPGNELIRNQLEGCLTLHPSFLEPQNDWLLALLTGRGDYVDASIINYIHMEWDSEFEPPFYIKKDVMEKTKVHGEWLYSIFELTIKCSSYWSYQGINLGSWQWFDGVINIWRQMPLQILLLDFYSLKSNARKKNDIRDEMRAVCEKISFLEPGINPSLNFFSLMLKTSIDLAKDSPKFKKNNLDPFVRKTRAVITKMESTGQTFEIRDGMAWERKGRGRHVRRFPAAHWQNEPIANP